MTKELLGKKIAQKVKDNEVIGVGTGSTVTAALVEIGKRIKAENLNISVVTSSEQSAWMCEEIGAKVLYSSYTKDIPWGFDGTDAIDDKLNIIKGRGAAMLGEKILAAKCKEFIILADESKYTDDVASKAPIPVEVIPQAYSVAKKGLEELGAKVVLREAKAKYGPVITEKGNLVLDANFKDITPELEDNIKKIVGVVESGLFLSHVTSALVSFGNEIKEFKK
ncbi:UNVERIFIED_CONTAM: hypothetical protein GTU68_011782 [Idotea baltica]|nr:hypothetical protein [Idotea baltica]